MIVQELKGFIIHWPTLSRQKRRRSTESVWVEARRSVQRTLISIFSGGQMNRHGCFSSHQSLVSRIRSRRRTRGTNCSAEIQRVLRVRRCLILNGGDSQTGLLVGGGRDKRRDFDEEFKRNNSVPRISESNLLCVTATGVECDTCLYWRANVLDLNSKSFHSVQVS